MIPAYNEEENIASVIKEIPRNIFRRKVKILVVDDGSRDATVAVAKKAGADQVISHKQNQGLGAAFRTGVDYALQTNAEILVTIDADGQFNPKDIPKIAEPVLKGEADMVTCSRF